MKTTKLRKETVFVNKYAKAFVNKYFSFCLQIRKTKCQKRIVFQSLINPKKKIIKKNRKKYCKSKETETQKNIKIKRKEK